MIGWEKQLWENVKTYEQLLDFLAAYPKLRLTPAVCFDKILDEMKVVGTLRKTETTAYNAEDFKFYRVEGFRLRNVLEDDRKTRFWVGELK